ncbi:MAG: sigma-70 family RNA polymerase sigma factor [Acidobacteriota bacterium]|nr:sigma-70 family RNA polymerase sigma factor [Blastocatellia bacterium]MDW8411130.1 sigma-70 family RNA polymerase sigma factor [Acidobacteriota bacterium]
MERTDEELMAEFQHGVEEAFVSLYKRYKLPVYRFIYRKLGNQHRAEELTQDVFCALIRHRNQWRNQASFKTYLYRIAFNCCISESRRTQNIQSTQSEDKASTTATIDSSCPLTQLEQKQLSQIIQAALGKLPSDYRDVLILREYEGLSYEQIAIVLDIPVGTVKSRLFRSKLELKQLLEGLLGKTTTPTVSQTANQTVK